MTTDSELDPAIAQLLAEAQSAMPGDIKFDESKIENPAHSSDEQSSVGSKNDSEDSGTIGVDLSVTQFKPITKFFEEKGHEYFNDSSYYKTCLGGEGQPSVRVHQVLTKYLKCTDAKDRTVFRQQLTTAYWELVHEMAPKMADLSLPIPKRFLLRFGVLLPSLFTDEQKTTFSKVIIDNNTGEPVYYLDEWFKEIASGRLSLSATDETRSKKTDPNSEQQHLRQLQSKNAGKLQSTETLLNAKENQRKSLESELRRNVDALCEHSEILGMSHHKMTYTEAQKKLFYEISEKLKTLQKIDRELVNCLADFEEAKSVNASLSAKIESAPAAIEVNKDDVNTEYNTVRQMAKMTVGRQGNQFPIFSREFYHCMPNGTGFRENVINIMSWIEENDPGAFCRIHKNTPNRIVPYVLLVPTYGDFGVCWEPFDRYNRTTSRGRIIIPMYPRDLKVSILMAVADLRWQVAKEKASYYWMEEGLTGQYYQWIEGQKLKGDLKSYFIADYVLWMTKEVNGVQRLDKEVRAIFWRFMPFSQAKKDELKKRSVVYQELYQRDINRSMSDGY